MFRSRFLLFIRYSYSLFTLESSFGRHRFFFSSSWSCGAFGRLTFARLDFHCAKENQQEKKEKQYFQFIFSFVDFSVHKTVIDFLLDWLLWPIFIAVSIVSSILNRSLSLAFSEWVSQLFSNRTCVIHMCTFIFSLFSISFMISIN